MMDMSSHSLYSDNNNNRTKNEVNLLKRNMTLDFNCSQSNKKQKFKSCVLESPDLKMLKLGSPELERMIMTQNGLVTPSLGLTPYLTKVDADENEEFCKPFVEALNHLHQTNGHINNNELINGNNNHNNNNINHNENTNHNHNHNSTHNNNSITSNSNNNNNSISTNNNSSNNNNTSSDSSADLTIAENPHNTNGYDNVFTTLLPASTTTITTVTTASNYSSMPNTIPHEQYVNVSNNSGGEVIINRTSSLPPYSAAVSNGMYPMTIKIEPHQQNQTSIASSLVPIHTSNTGLTPPISPQQVVPIDMADQEKIKLERKRLRNRIAASKCRRRKLERISRLEDKVKQLKGENTELAAVVNKLRDQVCSLKQQVMDHVKCGCQLMLPQQQI